MIPFALPRYLFVIDTDQYAGNFEREMCAYLTGNVGESEVGDDEAQLFFAETGEESGWDNVSIAYGEHGGNMATIYPGKSGVFNSVAICFSDRPDDQQLATMKERAEKFRQTLDIMKKKSREKITILGFRLVKIEIKMTEETV